MSVMKKISKIRKIVLIPRLIHASWREFLKGFLDRARIHPNWSIRLLQSPDELTPEHVDDIIANGRYRGMRIHTDRVENATEEPGHSVGRNRNEGR